MQPKLAKAHHPHRTLEQAGGVGGDGLLLHLDLLPLDDRVVSRDAEAQSHQHQHDGVLRHRFRVAPLIVAHIDPPLPGGLAVDAVVPYTLRVDHLQLWKLVHHIGTHIRDGIHKNDPRVRIFLGRLDIGLVRAAEHQLHRHLIRKWGPVHVIAVSGAKN